MIRLFIFCFFLLSNFCFAQNLSIGQWQDHLNYTRTKSVAVAGDRIYCATENSLFYYLTTDNSLEKLSKINGLSDMGFEFISYNNEISSLLIVYQNSNIDLIKGGKIINFSDIRRANIPGDKKIYSVSFHKEFAYLATGFGVVVFDMLKNQFRGTYYYGPGGNALKTNNVFIFEDKIFTASEKEIYSAPIDAINLADFNSWSKLAPLPWASDRNILSLIVFRGGLLATISGDSADNIYYYKNETWAPLLFNDKVSAISAFSDQYYIISNNAIKGFDSDHNTVLNITDFRAWLGPSPKAIDLDKDGNLWIADAYLGMIKYEKRKDHFEFYRINGPESNSLRTLTVAGDKLYIAPGGVDGAFRNLWNIEDVSEYHNFRWQNIYSSYLPEANFIDKVKVTAHPANSEHIFISSWFSGLLEIKDKQVVKLHNQRNSSFEYLLLQKPTQGEFDTIIKLGHSAFDKDNNLWVLNSTAQKPINLYKSDNTWHSFAIPGRPTQDNELEKIIITQNNHIWMTIPRNTSVGIYCFNHNNTPDDPSDDKVVAITSEKGKGGLPVALVRSIAEDFDGRIWVGTDQGVVVFNNPSAVFSSDNYDAQQILIKQEGNFQLLLENESVTAIAVDGANRKWFGTAGGGVFLMSPDGTEQIVNFNSENSPLLSNNIMDIGINRDGEVFFGTEKGLISYRGTATIGSNQFSQVYAFPNPVTPEYDGIIAIRGLSSEADIKITDISGNLVYKTKALGGQAIWDGRTRHGERAASGVYLVFAASKDGALALTTKIMIIN
jgi:hypothetical protein